jgi:hypothetical protein
MLMVDPGITALLESITVPEMDPWVVDCALNTAEPRHTVTITTSREYRLDRICWNFTIDLQNGFAASCLPAGEQIGNAAEAVNVHREQCALWAAPVRTTLKHREKPEIA